VTNITKKFFSTRNCLKRLGIFLMDKLLKDNGKVDILEKKICLKRFQVLAINKANSASFKNISKADSC